MAKLDRDNYLTTVNSDYGLEKSLTSNDVRFFRPKQEMRRHTLSSKDSARPDLLSAKYYGTLNYWWFILKVNRIDDIWNEMYIGMDIQIPDEGDILNFLNKKSKK
tara:strand:- start:14147 stop:14461 length:315 start_codon:yes stop_codon:yes gene_type:complete